MVTQSLLKELFIYDEVAGIFTRKVDRGPCRVGDIVGVLHHSGYLSTEIIGKNYFIHRLVWLYMTGKFPLKVIDHIDRDKLNNRFSNLRDVSQSENVANTKLKSNNTSGIIGVRFYKPRGNWVATITVNKVRKHLGYFKDKEAAIVARRIAEKECGYI